MPGGRLTRQDRQRIATGLAEGLGYTQIAKRLGRPASTVMREVTRNGGPANYRAEGAQAATRRRARRRKQARTQASPDLDSDSTYGRDPGAVSQFAESFVDLLVEQGMPRMTARVLTCLFTTDSGSLTAAELVQRLNVSPASISHAVGYLEQQGMLRRERTPGVRRERYVVDDEVLLRSLLATLRMNELLTDAARRGAEVLGGDTPAGARFEASADLLLMVSESLRRSIQQWRQSRAADAARPADPTDPADSADDTESGR